MTDARPRLLVPVLGAVVVLGVGAALLAPDDRPPAAAAPPVPTASAVPSSPPPSTPPPSAAPARGLARAAVDAATGRATGGTELAVAVLDRSTGELAANDRGNEPFYLASVAKLVVAVDVLDRRRLDGLTVPDADLDLLRRALGPSDDAAMSALWERFDGAGAAGRVSNRLGLSATTEPRRTGQWGELESTASDLATLWRHVLDGMPAADRDLLLGDMDAAPQVAADGFDQAFGLLAPAVRGSGAVAKQGWLCCFSGQYYLHSAGAVGADRRFVVVLLSRVPRSGGWDAARGELTGVATDAAAALR